MRTVLLVILVFAVLAVLSVILWIVSKVRRTSRAMFGTASLREGLAKQTQMLEQTPKSVSGMTKIYLPQIQADFPEFHYHEMRQHTEHTLRSVLSALDARDMTKLESASGPLREEIEHRLEGLGTKRFQDVKLHRTEITAYTKQKGTCTVTFQTALEYRDAEGTIPQKVQTKYNADLVFIQDPELAGRQDGAVGMTCPNCGASIGVLGEKYCTYCGSGLVELNLRIWQVNHVYEVVS